MKSKIIISVIYFISFFCHRLVGQSIYGIANYAQGIHLDSTTYINNMPPNKGFDESESNTRKCIFKYDDVNGLKIKKEIFSAQSTYISSDACLAPNGKYYYFGQSVYSKPGIVEYDFGKKFGKLVDSTLFQNQGNPIKLVKTSNNNIYFARVSTVGSGSFNLNFYKFNYSNNTHQFVASKTFTSGTSVIINDIIEGDANTLYISGVIDNTYYKTFLLKFNTVTLSFKEMVNPVENVFNLFFNSSNKLEIFSSPQGYGNTQKTITDTALNVLTTQTFNSVKGYKAVSISNNKKFVIGRLYYGFTPSNQEALIDVSSSSTYTALTNNVYISNTVISLIHKNGKVYFLGAQSSTTYLNIYDTISKSLTTVATPTNISYGNSFLERNDTLYFNSDNYYAINSSVFGKWEHNYYYLGNYIKNLTTNFVSYTKPTLSLHPNGKLYLLAAKTQTSVGEPEKAVIYEIDTINYNATLKKEFSTLSDGIPFSKLTLGSNGNFYGFGLGGIVNNGVVFEYNPTTNNYVKYDITGSLNNSVLTQNFLTLEEVSANTFYTVIRSVDGIEVRKFDANTGNFTIENALNVGSFMRLSMSPVLNNFKTFTFNKNNNSIYFSYNPGNPNKLYYTKYDIASNVFHNLDSISNGPPSFFIYPYNPFYYNNFVYGQNGIGAYNVGAIVKKSCLNNTQTTVYSHQNPYNDVVNPTDGAQKESVIYYTNATGGYKNAGSLYKFNLTTDTYQSLAIFDSIIGYMPSCITVLNATFNFTTTSTSGINEQTVNPIRIYPNPTNGVLNIELDMSYKSCQLGVYNVMGQKVFSEVNSNNTFKINIQGLQPGVYFIEATNTFGKTTRVKFVKE